MDEDLLFLRKLTDWQGHPHVEESSEEMSATAGCIFNLPVVATYNNAPAEMRRQNSLLPLAQAETELQNSRRPFLSLMLPEWVHEKSEAEEAAGIITRRSLKSFHSSPIASSCCSPAEACLGGSMIAACLDVEESSPAPQKRRSTVRWIDLVENDEENLYDPWAATSDVSGVSTAASSPEAAPVEKFENKWRKANQFSDAGDSTDAVLPQDFFETTVERATGQAEKVRWVDLVESELDPLDYMWSSRSLPPHCDIDDMTLKSRVEEAEENQASIQEHEQAQQLAVEGTLIDRYSAPQQTPRRPVLPEALGQRRTHKQRPNPPRRQLVPGDAPGRGLQKPSAWRRRAHPGEGAGLHKDAKTITPARKEANAALSGSACRRRSARSRRSGARDRRRSSRWPGCEGERRPGFQRGMGPAFAKAFGRPEFTSLFAPLVVSRE